MVHVLITAPPGPLGSTHSPGEGPVELAQRRRREAEERPIREDVELAAELEATQLAEEEERQKEERQWRLAEIQREYKDKEKRKEAEKSKGKKRKVEELEDLEEGSVKRKKRGK